MSEEVLAGSRTKNIGIAEIEEISWAAEDRESHGKIRLVALCKRDRLSPKSALRE